MHPKNPEPHCSDFFPFYLALIFLQKLMFTQSICSGAWPFPETQNFKVREQKDIWDSFVSGGGATTLVGSAYSLALLASVPSNEASTFIPWGGAFHQLTPLHFSTRSIKINRSRNKDCSGYPPGSIKLCIWPRHTTGVLQPCDPHKPITFVVKRVRLWRIQCKQK